MPKRTNPFQQLTASIFAIFHEPEYKVTESVLCKVPETGAIREIDVLVSNVKDPKDSILIECRAHKRRQDVTWIDQLCGKRDSLGLRRVIAVSKSGFYKTTIREAERRGVEALHLAEAEERDWKAWHLAIPAITVDFSRAALVRSVTFEVHPDYAKGFPLHPARDEVFIADARTRVKCPIRQWVDSFRKDPKTLAELEKRDANGVTNHYTWTIPIDPGIGVVVGDRFVPLIQLVLEVDSLRAKFDVPLEHYDVWGQHIQVGSAVIGGVPITLGTWKTGNILKTMMEYRVPTDRIAGTVSPSKTGSAAEDDAAPPETRRPVSKT